MSEKYKQYTALIADDDPEVLDLLVSELGDIKNIQTVVASTDGLDALLKLRNQDFDLVVLDYLMPKKTAIEIINDVKRKFTLHGTQVIVISGNLNPEDLKEVIKLGVRKVMIKPFTDDEFLTEVSKIIKLDLS